MALSLSPPAVLVQADQRDLRIYEGLQRRGYRLIGFPVPFVHQLTAQGIAMQPADIADAPPQEVQRRARQLLNRVQDGVARELRSREFAKFVRRSPASAPIREALQGNLRNRIFAGALGVEGFAHLVERENVRLVVVRDENAFPAKSLVQAARVAGIPSLHVMHGMPWAPAIDSHITSSRVAVYGPWTRDWYLRNGNDPDRIAVTGNVAWDGYRMAAGAVDASAIQSSLGLDPALPVVLFATTICGHNRAADFVYWDWPWQHFQATVQALGQLTRRRPIQFLIKLHPMDDRPGMLDRHVDLARSAGLHTTGLKGWADPRHLLATNAVICLDSTIAIEAMLLDRPVVNLRLGDLLPGFLYDHRDGMLQITRASEIADAVEAAISDSAVQASLAERRVESLYRYNYLNDGRAADRVLHTIDRLLSPAQAEAALCSGGVAALTDHPSAPELASVQEQHLAQARDELSSGRLAEAAYLADRAEQLGAGHSASYLLGFLAYQRGDVPSALTHFQTAAAGMPDNAEYHNALAGALHEAARSVEAEAAVRRALAIDPIHLDALANLGEILLAAGRNREALEVLRRASTLAPHDPLVQQLLQRARPADVGNQ